MSERIARHPIVREPCAKRRVQTQRVIEQGYLDAWKSLVGVFAPQLDLHKFLTK